MNSLILPSDLTEDIIKRLNTISGQIEGITKMLKDSKDPEQILIQFKSVDRGLQKAHYRLLDEVYRKALAIKIVKTVDDCPGNCGSEEKIEFIRKQFPDLKLDDLTKKMKEISELQERLARYKAENNSV